MKKSFDETLKNIIDELEKEIKKYPKPKNEINVAGYCLKIIDNHNKLTGYEKNSFSNHISRIMVEQELEGYKQALKDQKEEIRELIEEKFQSWKWKYSDIGETDNEKIWEDIENKEKEILKELGA